MKKVKSVAFNIADPMEFVLYQHAQDQRYFSTYVKRLIQRDMESGQKIDFSKYEDSYNEYMKLEENKES